MQPIRFIMVGGFLGAGKTTLLAQAARRLVARGLRVGIITNDQASHLVDTENLRWQGMGVSEVAGGCFCCRYEDMLRSAQELIDRARPDVLLGEPVGSCTDLSATVLQPLKQLAADRFHVAPFSVLADVRRLRDLLSGRAHDLFPDSVLYIYAKQLEEADLILLNKTDLVKPEELTDLAARLSAGHPLAAIRAVSALKGDGVDAWLDAVLSEAPGGRRITSVDYDVYADGEAELGWLNALIDLSATGGADWAAPAQRLLEDLRRAFAGRGAEIAHLKVFLTAPGGAIVGSLTHDQDQPLILRHGAIRNDATSAELIINARVRLAPDELRADVEEAVGRIFGTWATWRFRSIEAFRPSRPQPTHRYDQVVGVSSAGAWTADLDERQDASRHQ